MTEKPAVIARPKAVAIHGGRAYGIAVDVMVDVQAWIAALRSQ